MNFLHFEGGFRRGSTAVKLGGTDVELPALQEEAEGRKLVLGVRPEHITLADAAPYRGRVLATEYLGTTQIITVEAQHGTLKVRAPSNQVARAGETVGMTFSAPKLALFDHGTGRAFRTAANAGVLHG